MKIGVFDSGIGGLSVAKAIERALPKHTVVFADDVTHLPYGSKTPKELLKYAEPVLRRLIEEGCEVIVIACNTVSTTVITPLRNLLPVPLIAVEPMVKPAAQLTSSGTIAVCATPATLKSSRYSQLKAEYAKGVKVLEPDCSKWAAMIQRDEVDEAAIAKEIGGVLEQGADVIVLGCTHYHWIEATIKRLASSRATVIQPEPAIVAQLKRVIALL